jgi:8-oxo-dGTP pyrophosphatase MutT (NUDIX family)
MSPRARLLSRLYRIGFPVMKTVWRVTRPRKRGAKCVLRRGDDVLLVRHTYGDRGRWDLPGGLVKRGEEPLDGARRELFEETGLDVGDWSFIGVLEARLDNRRDTLYCFSAEVDGTGEVEIDGAEILEARWFPSDSLPDRLTPGISRMLTLDDPTETAATPRPAPGAGRARASSEGHGF